MKMRTSTLQTFVVGLAILSVGACAELRNLPKKGQFSAMTISGGACTADLPVEGGSRGLFAVHGYRDYIERSLRFSGQGFLTKKPLDKGIDPYDVIGLRPKSTAKASEKKDYSGIEYANVGASIGVQLGENTVEPKAVMADEATSPNQLADEASVLKASTLGTSVDTLALAQQANGTYVSNTAKQFTLPLNSLAESPESEGGKAVMSTTGDVRTIRSLVMSNLVLDEKPVGLVATVPAGVEPEGKSYEAPIKGTIGSDLVLTIAGDPEAPEGKSVVTVQIQELPAQGKTPTWRALCTAVDPSGTQPYELKVPTEWKSANSSGALKDGKVEITITRRRLADVPVGENLLYVESGMGIRTTGEIAKKPKPEKP